jgi:hypothetical protein
MPYTPLNLSDIYKSSAARPLNPLQMQQAMMNKAKMGREATTRGILRDPNMTHQQRADALLASGNQPAYNAAMSEIRAAAGEGDRRANQLALVAEREKKVDDRTLFSQLWKVSGDDLEVLELSLREAGLWEYMESVQKARHGRQTTRRGELQITTDELGVEHARHVRREDTREEGGWLSEDAKASARYVVDIIAGSFQAKTNAGAFNDDNDLQQGHQDWKDPLGTQQLFLDNMVDFLNENLPEGAEPVERIMASDAQRVFGEAITIAGGEIMEGWSVVDGVPVADTGNLVAVIDEKDNIMYVTNAQLASNKYRPLSELDKSAPMKLWDKDANDGKGGEVHIRYNEYLKDPNRYGEKPANAPALVEVWDKAAKKMVYRTRQQVLDSNDNLVPEPDRRQPMELYSRRDGETRLVTWEEWNNNRSNYTPIPEGAASSKAVYNRETREMEWANEEQIAASNGNLTPKPDKPGAPMTVWDNLANGGKGGKALIKYSDWEANRQRYTAVPDGAPSQQIVYDSITKETRFASNEEIDEDPNLVPIPRAAPGQHAVYDPTTEKNVLVNNAEIEARKADDTLDNFERAQPDAGRPMELFNLKTLLPDLVSLKEWEANPDDYAAMPSGMSFSVDADGNVEMSTGGEHPAATNARIDKKIMATTDSFVKMVGLASEYNPVYLTIPFKAKTWWDGIKAKFSADGLGGLTDEEVAQMDDFYQFARDSVEMLNQYIHDITGAQMSAAEIVRLTAAMPNIGRGIFDGDNPILFRSKLRAAIEETIVARARYIHYKNQNFNDLDPENLGEIMSLTNMRDMMEGRETYWMDQGLDEDAVVEKLREEFGII